MDFIKADEARNITNEAQNTLPNLLDKISYCIKGAAETGARFVQVNLTDDEAKHLNGAVTVIRSKGYTVSWGRSAGESARITINW